MVSQIHIKTSNKAYPSHFGKAAASHHQSNIQVTLAKLLLTAKELHKRASGDANSRKNTYKCQSTHNNMWALVVEAILAGGFSWELALEAFFEVVKVADLVSDINFIIALWQFDSVLGDVNVNAPELLQVNQPAFLISSIAFTAVGFVFTLGFGIVQFMKCCQDNPPNFDKENAKDKRGCWNLINFLLEDLPQFLILLLIVSFIAYDDYLPCNTFLDTEDTGTISPTEEKCTDEQRDYVDKLELDAVISLLCTSLSCCRNFVFCCRMCCQCKCCICCSHEKWHGTPTSSSWEENTSHPQSVGYDENATECVSETIYPDGSKIIRTEVLSGDGTPVTTTTMHVHPDDNFWDI